MAEEQTQPAETTSQFSEGNFAGLVDQIRREYTLAWKHQEPKKKEAETRLKLYNNQKRDKKAVGDTTLFTIMQTVLASLYDDELVPGFGGREEGDDEQTDNLDAMAEFDYDEMGKDVKDYDWDWDTCFFGYGILQMEEYVRDPDNNRFYPLPKVIDPIVFLRDPDGTSINGDPETGEGSCRFFGFPSRMGKEQMKDNEHIFQSVKDTEFGDVQQESQEQMMNLMRSAQNARDEAQGRQSTDKQSENLDLGTNTRYDVLIWYTFYKNADGEVQRVKCWLTNGGSKLIGVQVLKKNYWQFVYRQLFRTSHDFDGVSIPDLVEDKQRARALIANLGLNALKADVQPMYVYDSNKVTNRKDLKFGYNKFIPVDAKGENINTAIAPMQKARFNMQLVDFIYTILDVSAQKATATPDIQQGIQSQENRPLGETNLVKTGVDTRYSLAAKVFGWSEQDFWQQWYMMYYDYFADDIDEKVLRLVGAFGAKWRTLSKSDFITRINPDIKIESKAVNRAKQIEERRELTGYYSLALQEPTANRRYGLKKLGRLYGQEKDELDRLFPPTIDERVAEDENDDLNKDKFVGVSREDDHNVHLEIHAKARETDAAKAHIETHKKALMIKKLHPEWFPQDQQTDFQAPAGEMQLPIPGRGMQPNQRPIAPSQAPGGAQ